MSFHRYAVVVTIRVVDTNAFFGPVEASAAGRGDDLGPAIEQAYAAAVSTISPRRSTRPDHPGTNGEEIDHG